MDQTSPTIEDITRLIITNILVPLSLLPPVYSRAALHVVIEGNHNWTIAEHIASVFRDYVRNDGRMLTFYQHQTTESDKVPPPPPRIINAGTILNTPHQVGFWTSHEAKEVGCQLLASLLRSNSVFFDAHFFGQKSWLLEQLGRMRKILKRSSIENGDVHVITGKTHAHKLVEHQDDQVMALLIGLLIMHRWLNTVRTNLAKRVRV